jgi:hypothetical protein
MSKPRDQFGDRDVGPVEDDLAPGERISPMTEAELEFGEEYKPEIDMQGSRCSVCKHPETEVIDKHLVEMDIRIDQIAGLYGLSESALGRHKKDCILGVIKRGREILKRQRENQKIVKTLDKVDELYDIGKGLLVQAAGDRNVGDSLALMTKLEDNLRLRGELNGELVGANGPAPGMIGTGQGMMGPGGIPGGRVQLIVLPQVYGKTAEEIAKLTAATPLEVEIAGEVVDG